MDAVDVYIKVVELYETHKYTHPDIAKKLNISTNAVAWCTRNLGYYHTKAKNGRKPIYDIELINKGLGPLL